MIDVNVHVQSCRNAGSPYIECNLICDALCNDRNIGMRLKAELITFMLVRAHQFGSDRRHDKRLPWSVSMIATSGSQIEQAN